MPPLIRDLLRAPRNGEIMEAVFCLYIYSHLTELAF